MSARPLGSSEWGIRLYRSVPGGTNGVVFWSLIMRRNDFSYIGVLCIANLI